MTELEMVRLCAEAMGIAVEAHPIRGNIMRHWYMDANVEREYNPIHNDAQAMALDSIILASAIMIANDQQITFVFPRASGGYPNALIFSFSTPDERRRARVECVAKMQPEKMKA